MKSYTFLLYFSVIIICVNARESCDTSTCNHEADCYKIDGKIICECIGDFYAGEFCQTPKDNCQSNPCRNGGTCHPYLGHYYCECPDGYSDQTCSSQNDFFRAVHIHYNHLARVGRKQPILLTMEYLGKEQIFIELLTLSNLIEGFAYSPPGSEFKLSKDLQTLGKKLDIRHSNQLPYKRGYYRVVYGTFYKLGINALNFQIRQHSSSQTVFFQTLNIYGYDPTHKLCLPNAIVRTCSSPQNPLRVDIATFNFFEPVVRHRCDDSSRFKVKWSIRNFVGSIVLKTYDMDVSTTLVVSPYSLWFNYRDDYPRSYLLHGDMYEVNRKGGTIGSTVVRCYIRVDVKPVQARIVGGSYREVGVNGRFTIDSSISRDYAIHPHKNQKLIYSWSCTTDGVPTRYCIEDMGSASHLTIPPRALTLGQNYKFQVTVRSSIHVKKTHNTTQEIKIVTKPPLLLHFDCLRNCEDSKFSAGKLIHLKILCIECPRGETIYFVTNTRGDGVATGQHIILTDEKGPEIVLNATVQIGERSGSTIIKLGLNSPPDSGSCSADPTEGQAFETIFKIVCRGYKDDDLPLSYKFYGGTTIIRESASPVLQTNLFPTANNICELKIKICDNFASCIEVQIQVTIRPLVPEGSWLDFLNQDNSSLQRLINDGDRDSAFTLVQSVIPHISSADGLDVTKLIVQCFRNLPVRRLMAAEQILTVTKKLFEVTELSSESAVAVSELFSKVAYGLINSILNGEIYDLPLDAQEQMLGEVITSMKKSSTVVQEFPLVHNAEFPPPDDPFQENYPDYGELKIDDVIQITNWLTSFTNMHKCLQVMGVASAFIQFPDEKPILIGESGVISRTVIIDKSEPVSVSWNESSTFVDLSNAFLSSLRGDEIAVQLTIFDSNPFWWSPEQYQSNTKVLSVGAYTRNLSSLKPSRTRVSFSYFMAIESNGKNDTGSPIEGKITKPNEVSVYERLLPPNAILVITFSSLEKDIRVLLVVGKKPRNYMLSNAKTLKASDSNATLFLANRKSKESQSFIAVASDSETTFSFVMLTRLCVSWDEKKKEWNSKFCSVGEKTNSTHIHCSCWHLSMFAAKVHPVFANPQPSIGLVDWLPFNFHLLVFHLLVILILCLLLWLAWKRSNVGPHNLIVLHNKTSRKHKHKYVVTIVTNGHDLAATSSNVTVQLHGSETDSEAFTLYPSECCSFFERLNQTSFTVTCPISLGDLQSVSIYHDSFGRYPSWNCHTVKVRDEQNHDEYIFLVDQWLSDVESTNCRIYTHLAQKDHIKTRKQVLRDALANIFANWYAQQAICPFRLYGDLTALEKTSIFILRVCLVLVVTMFVFGPTTLETFDEERETYYTMLMDSGDLLWIAFWCHLVGVVITVAVQYAFFMQRQTAENGQYTLVYKD